jgi:hypothetical protein
MNKKYFILYAIAGLLATLFVPAGCDDDIRSPLERTDEILPALTVDMDTVNARAMAGAYTVNVTCEADWIAYNDNTLFPWVTVSSGNATGNGVFTINVEPLPGDLAERTAPVTVRLPGSTRMYREVIVRQVEEEPDVTVTGIPNPIPINGGTFAVDIVSNAQWTVSLLANVTWVSIDPVSGTGNCPATLTVASNAGGHAKRVADLRFRAGVGQKLIPIAVNQEGAPVSLSVTNDFPAEVSGAGAAYTITITSNAAWSVTSDVNWLHFNPASGDGNGVVTATVTPNNMTIVRTGTVAITAFDETRSIGVSQAGTEPYLIINGLRWLKFNVTDNGQQPAGLTYGSTFTPTDASSACPSGWRLATLDEWLAIAGGASSEWGMNGSTSDRIEVDGVNGLYILNGNASDSDLSLSTHVFLPFINNTGEGEKQETAYAVSGHQGIKINPWDGGDVPYHLWFGGDNNTEQGKMHGQRVRCVQNL